jgi:hypothetical protein
MTTDTWTVADSAALYRVSGWGDPAPAIALAPQAPNGRP